MFLLKPPFIGDCLLPCLMKPEGKVLVAWMIWMIWMLEFRKCMKMHQVRNMQKDVLWMVGIPNSFPPKTGDRLICVWISWIPTAQAELLKHHEVTMAISKVTGKSWDLRWLPWPRTENLHVVTWWPHPHIKDANTATIETYWDLIHLDPLSFDLLRSAKKARRSKVHWHHPEGLEGPTRHSHLESGSIPNTQHHTT